MRVVVADSQTRVRFALRTLLKRQDGIEVVGEAATASELLDQVRLTQPDLVLLHWRLQETAPGLMGRLQKLRPDLRVIALSARCETRYEALRAGAEAFIWKTEQPEKLLAAIAACGPAVALEGRAGPGAGDGGRRPAQPRLSPAKGSLGKDTREEGGGDEPIAGRNACFVPHG